MVGLLQDASSNIEDAAVQSMLASATERVQAMEADLAAVKEELDHATLHLQNEKQRFSQT